MNRFSCLKRQIKREETLEILNKEKDTTTAVNEETGELYTFTDNRSVRIDDYGLVDRFSLQSVSKEILGKYRISKCLRIQQSNSKDIGVLKNIEHNSVFYSGLQTCGSVWHCPCCASKISERRASEVKKAIEYTQNLGGIVSFVTRTIPHTNKDKLSDILKKYKLAENHFVNHRFYKKTNKIYSYFGRIKVYEINAGLNGWHLHTHELIFHKENKFINKDLKIFYSNYQKSLYSCWKDASIKAGFDKPSIEHGLQVQNGDFASDYIAKWGKQPQSNWSSYQELTKQHIKKSKSGYSPFDLLRLYRDKPSDNLRSIIYEYGSVLKGKQQLIWSRGLKDLINLKELTDKEIAESKDEEAFLMGTIPLEQWRFIRKNNLIPDVLIICKNHDFNTLTKFLYSLGSKPIHTVSGNQYTKLAC